MRLPTLLSAASFAFALASPAISQQPRQDQPRQDMREEIRRIVRDEVRAAIHEAMQEMHGGAMGMMGHAGEPKPEPKAERQKGGRPELGELENEMKELEATLEKLQGEIGKRVGTQVRGQLQPLVRARLDGQNQQDVKLKEVHVAPGARVFKLGGEDGETIELKLDGGQVHVLTPQGQKAFQSHIDGERNDAPEKSEAPKSKKSAKIVKAPMVLPQIALPMGGQPTVLRAGDGCNCVVVIRCENGTCRIETSCNGSPLAPVQSKTTAPKAKTPKAKKAKGSDDDDDDDDGDGEQSAAKVEVKLDAGCCETPAKSVKSDCCGSACTGCAPAAGCCESKPEAAKTEKPKETPKKQIN